MWVLEQRSLQKATIPSTIKEELATNPFMRVADAAIQVSHIILLLLFIMIIIIIMRKRLIIMIIKIGINYSDNNDNKTIINLNNNDI